MLQNLHLMSKRFKKFENQIKTVSQNAAPKFRCFISSESPALPTIYIIQEPMFDRRKFGAIGWSTKYNFNEVDLQICADVLNNFLYEDLRYLYGEIMYGGHITYKRAFKPLRRAAWALN